VQFPLRLVARRMLAPGVAHLSFTLADGEPLTFVPGQFLPVHFAYGDGTPTKRSYSLATRSDEAGDAGELVDIAVSYVPGGAASALCGGLEIADGVPASCPYGRFCLLPGDTAARALLIATATGAAPFRAVRPLLDERIRGHGTRVVLLF